MTRSKARCSTVSSSLPCSTFDVARGLKAHPGYEMLVQQIPEYLSFFGFDSLARTLQADASDVRTLLQLR